MIARANTGHTDNNIVINSCSGNHDNLKQSKSVMSQTDTARNISEELLEINDPEYRPGSSPTSRDTLPGLHL